MHSWILMWLLVLIMHTRSFKRHSYLNSYWSAPSVPPPTKKFVENVIDLSQHVEIDLSRFRQVSNIFLSQTFCICRKHVSDLLETCRKHVADYVENVFSTCFRQDRSNGIWLVEIKVNLRWACICFMYVSYMFSCILCFIAVCLFGFLYSRIRRFGCILTYCR